MMKLLLFVVLVLFCVAPIVVAQADCPAIVTAALNTAAEACVQLGRDQACYGNITLDATPRANATEFSFEQTGDIVNLEDIDSLTLGSLSLTDESWGIALMKVQANIPDSSPENVTVVLFGNVTIRNEVPILLEIPMLVTENVDVNLFPYEYEPTIFTSLDSGTEVIANGRLGDNSWIRIAMNEDQGGEGWISANFLTSEGDINNLLVVEPRQSQFRTMQAFTLRVDDADASCVEASNNGILIQTPAGVGEISFVINEVTVRLGSTAYLQTVNGFLVTNVIEGYGIVSADGTIQFVPAGTSVRVPLDENGFAIGAPEAPVPYDDTALAILPITLLPQTVAITPTLASGDIEPAIEQVISSRGLAVGVQVITGGYYGGVVCPATTPPPWSQSDVEALVCNLPENMRGVIIDGPAEWEDEGGVAILYLIEFDNGFQGWVQQQYLVVTG